MEPSVSERAAPVLLAHEKDGYLQFCVAYRNLNTMTIRNSYPLPRMDEFVASLREENVFTILYTYNGYLQVRIALKDLEKASFIRHVGTYQYVCFFLVWTPTPNIS